MSSLMNAVYNDFKRIVSEKLVLASEFISYEQLPTVLLQSLDKTLYLLGWAAVTRHAKSD